MSNTYPSRREPSLALGLATATTMGMGALYIFGVFGSHNSPSETDRPQVLAGPGVHWVPKQGALPFWNSTRDPSGHINFYGDKVDPDAVVLHQVGKADLCATKGGSPQSVRVPLPAVGPAEAQADAQPDPQAPTVDYQLDSGVTIQIRQDGHGGLVGDFRGSEVIIKLPPIPAC